MLATVCGVIIWTDDEAKIAQSYRSQIFSSPPARGRFLKIGKNRGLPFSTTSLIGRQRNLSSHPFRKTTKSYDHVTTTWFQLTMSERGRRDVVKSCLLYKH
jgi:hypothetical protein